VKIVLTIILHVTKKKLKLPDFCANKLSVNIQQVCKEVEHTCTSGNQGGNELAMVYIVKLVSDKPDYMPTVDWFPKINTVVHSQVQMCDAEASGTDLTETSGTDFAETSCTNFADWEVNSVHQEV